MLEHCRNRSDGEIILIVFDVDRLRLINTLFGTNEGDKVVCAFAEAIKHVAGKGDVVGRVDTDDFAVSHNCFLRFVNSLCFSHPLLKVPFLL